MSRAGELSNEPLNLAVDRSLGDLLYREIGLGCRRIGARSLRLADRLLGLPAAQLHLGGTQHLTDLTLKSAPSRSPKPRAFQTSADGPFPEEMLLHSLAEMLMPEDSQGFRLTFRV